jgi:2-oxoglutarate decarboxylase
LELINAYRTRGHLLADIDPLNMTSHHAAELDLENFDLTIWDLDREFITGGCTARKPRLCAKFSRFCAAPTAARSASNIATFKAKKKNNGCASRSGSKFVDTEPLAAETKKELLQKLIEAEQFEQFLHKKYLGQKRFSLEGCETVIPMLDQLVENASARGVEEIFLGMAHRGR